VETAHLCNGAAADFYPSISTAGRTGVKVLYLMCSRAGSGGGHRQMMEGQRRRYSAASQSGATKCLKCYFKNVAEG
jgi:hypothetical protein